MSNQDEEEARHLLHQQYERPEQQSYASTQDDITAAIAGIRSRLDTLASINADNGTPVCSICRGISVQVYTSSLARSLRVFLP